MYSARYSPKWFSTAIKRARESRTRTRRVQIDSSASNRSVEARQPRHRKEPTSGRGKAKRVMALTTDSDTGPDSSGETARDKQPPRQVAPSVFHAPDPPGVAPPFQPRIARLRGTRRNDPRGHSSATQPILEMPMPHEIHFSDRNSHPPLTPQSLEKITAAANAVLNQHLASIGLLPRVATTPLGDPITNTDRYPPRLEIRLRLPRELYRSFCASPHLPPARFYPAHIL